MPVAVALGLFYAAMFLGTGASMPFMPVWFRDRGLSGAEIAAILSAPMLARTIAGPALALWADSFRLRRTPMALLGFGGAAAFASLALLHGFWGWLVAWLLGSTLIGVLSPLADVITLRRAGAEGFNYGWPRGVGSAGYVVGNVVMGLLLLRLSSAAVLAWTIAAAALAGLCAWRVLPADPVRADRDRIAAKALIAGLGDLLHRPAFLLAIGAVGLIQGSHGFYYSFSSLLWRRQGIAEGWIGVLWGFGVVVEIGFMWFMEPWRRRVGPRRLLIIGGVGAVVRWAALAVSPGLVWLFALQALHALSFTATFLASLRLVEQFSPARNASAAQTVNSSVSTGFVGLATIGSGPLFDAFGAHGYLAMAALAALGLAGALAIGGRPEAGATLAARGAA